MTSDNLARPALIAFLLFALAIASWEIYLRNDGANNAYDDSPPLWAHTRSLVYLPKDKSTVFIGSSRIKFDLDTKTWTALTGDIPVQLACVGSSPLPTLYDLAKDTCFKGKLVIDVTEGLFFSTNDGNRQRPNDGLKYYHDITPAQLASFVINTPMEASFVFLDKENYSLNSLLDKLELKSRPGVFNPPIFPRDFDRTYFDRQSSSVSMPSLPIQFSKTNRSPSGNYLPAVRENLLLVVHHWIQLYKPLKQLLIKSNPAVEK